MKKFILIGFLVFAGFGAFAQKFAYVDTEYILKHLPEYKSSQNQLNVLTQQWQKEVDADFVAIDKMYKAYQADQVLLTDDLRKSLDLIYLFISHDLSVVSHIADRVVIMYLGRIVETGSAAEIFDNPNHPYTAALLSEVPRIDRRHRAFNPIKGEIPSPMNPPSGCHFHPRCPHAFERCKTERPQLRILDGIHESACHLNDLENRPSFKNPA